MARCFRYFKRMPTSYPAESITIEGADAATFAQAQFSSNLASLDDGHWQFSAWLDAQGRVRAFFHLLRLDKEHLRLLLRGGHAHALAESLQRYVFRAKARVTAQPAAQLATADPLPAGALAIEGSTLVLGCGSHSMVLGTLGDEQWRLPQVRAGWPWLAGDTSGQLLPPWLNLEGLGATALDKGCYPGQEIVARMHYRGGNKRQLCRVHLSQRVAPGQTLTVEDAAPIQLLDVVAVGQTAEALAVVHQDLLPRLESELRAAHGDQPVHIRALPA